MTKPNRKRSFIGRREVKCLQDNFHIGSNVNVVKSLRFIGVLIMFLCNWEACYRHSVLNSYRLTTTKSVENYVCETRHMKLELDISINSYHKPITTEHFSSIALYQPCNSLNSHILREQEQEERATASNGSTSIMCVVVQKSFAQSMPCRSQSHSWSAYLCFFCSSFLWHAKREKRKRK